jgi:hypothetical protein
MIGRALTAGVTALLLASASESAEAQGWTLDGYAGQAIYDPVSANVGTSHGVLGVRYGGVADGWFYLSAAAPFAAEDPLWGALGAGQRLVVQAARLSVGLDLAAEAYGYRDPFSRSFGAGATTQALPFAALVHGVARMEIHSGIIHHGNTFAGHGDSRIVHDSGARLSVGRTLPLALAAESRYVRTEEGGYPYAGGLAALARGKVEIWAGIGRWFSDALPDLSWGTGASVRLSPAMDGWVSIRQESAQPLYWNDTRRSWNVGLSRRLGPAARAESRGPPPAQGPGGRVTIRLPRTEGEATIYIAGDFTGWAAVPMIRDGAHWAVTLVLEPGFYRYAFRTEDERWFVPESVQGRRPDGFGGHVAVLVVP